MHLSDSERKRILETKDDAMMMRHPILWDMFPFLCLARGEGHPLTRELAVLHEKEGFTVIIGNLIIMVDDESYFKQCPRKPYESPEAIIADGWRVD